MLFSHQTINTTSCYIPLLHNFKLLLREQERCIFISGFMNFKACSWFEDRYIILILSVVVTYLRTYFLNLPSLQHFWLPVNFWHSFKKGSGLQNDSNKKISYVHIWSAKPIDIQWIWSSFYLSILYQFILQWTQHVWWMQC